MNLASKPVALRLVIAGIVLLLLFGPVITVRAHAELVRSDPAAGAVLPTPPQAVVLEFSEDLDPGFSSARLLDGNGDTIVAGPGELDPNLPRTLKLALPPLADGVYSVQWKARSAEDGHVTLGSVGFSVGAASPRASLLPPVGAPDPATTLPSPLDMLLRWTGYLALALVEGSLAFGMLVWRSAMRAGAPPEIDTSAAMARALRLCIWSGAGGMALAGLGLVVFQAAQASSGSLADALAGLVVDRTGVLLGLRVLFLGGVAWIAARSPRLAGKPAWPGWLGMGLCAGLALTFSLQSHNAALGSPLALLSDWLHLLAMGAWMGGLLPLGWALRRAPALAGKLVPRFSRLALVCVAALAATGVYSALAEVGSLAALTGTTYGRAVMLKSILLLFLIVLGGINLLGLSPRLDRPASPAVGWLKRTTLAESLLGGVILLAAGALTAIAPGREALAAERRQGYKSQVKAGEVTLVLRVAPLLAGENEFGVEFKDPRPGASQAPPTVLLRFTMLSHAMGESQVQAASTDGKRYTARGSYLSMVGPWQVEVILRRPGFNDITHAFDLSVTSNADEALLPNPVPPTTGSIEAGRVLYQSNCLPCHGPAGKGDGPVGLTLNPRPADLSVHTAPGVHTDGQLFLWISNGYPGSAMPAFKDAISESDRWNLVNFIRTLALVETPQPAPTMPPMEMQP
jgi:copper transport protein